MAGRGLPLLTFVLLAFAVAAAAADQGLAHVSWNRGARSLQEQSVGDLFNKLMKQLQTLQTPTLPPPPQVTHPVHS